MFKSILAASALALATFTSTVANAAPNTCAFLHNGDLQEFTCDHSIRTNANGHRVNDLVWFDPNGKRVDVSIIWWTDNGAIEYAEMFVGGQRTAAQGFVAKNGAWCVRNNARTFCVH